MTNVFIVSAPSGSGKSTLVARLLASEPNLLFSVSYTTRLRRGREVPGEDYTFISRAEFEDRIAKDEFLEHAEVFGNYYGTHRSVYDRALLEGKDLILDIDVQGARQLKERFPEAVSVFILAPSRDVLEQRLRNRSEDTEQTIARRLREAAEEIRNYDQYDYVVVNYRVEESVSTLTAIVRAERVRRSRMEDKIQPILQSFESSLGIREKV
ncbi:MAG TPA: guanylate kinase [Bryobacteraceae bacterium]|jgi:guanylate kinase|nr:guanylate kinase [Bryobacteraceae bacterium]